MKELNARLKSGNFDSVYIFFGQETYLIRAYEKRLITALFPDGASEMNVNRFTAEGADVWDVISAAGTPPFLSDKRLVILKNTGLLQPGKKEPSEKLCAYLAELPPHCVLLFSETEKPPDKRAKLYKAVSAKGFAVEFTTPPEQELAAWVANVLGQEGVGIDKATASAFLRRAWTGAKDGGIMEGLHTELLKLAAYKGIDDVVVLADIEQICTEGIESKVFTLVKEIGGRSLAALTTLSNLLASKEPPLMILSMMARQFRLMLICKGLKDKGNTPAQIAEAAGLRDFWVTDFLRQGANFTAQQLICALEETLRTEFSVKSGKMADRTALEMLIVKTVGGL